LIERYKNTKVVKNLDLKKLELPKKKVSIDGIKNANEMKFA